MSKDDARNRAPEDQVDDAPDPFKELFRPAKPRPDDDRAAQEQMIPISEEQVFVSVRTKRRVRDKLKADATRHGMTIGEYFAHLVERGLTPKAGRREEG